MSAPASEKLVSIGAAVELLRDQYPDVTHSSLRFLEREGLISSSRTAGGHRLYTQGDIDRVLLIKSWQRQGRSLDDIRTLLESRSQLLDPTEISRQFLELALSSQLEQAGRHDLAGGSGWDGATNPLLLSSATCACARRRGMGVWNDFGPPGKGDFRACAESW